MINFAMVGYYVSDCGCKNNEFVKLKKGGYKTPAQLEKEGYKVVQFHGIIPGREVQHTGYVFIRGKEVTIAYRGTCNSYDFKKDVEIPLIRQYELLPKGGKIHLGFYSVFENSWESLYGILKGYANDQGLEIRDLKINLTGHSMGGAVANIAALCLSVTENVKNLHVATFGAPRVFDCDAAKVCNELFGRKTIRVVDRSDFIPSLPPNFMGYKHIGKQLKIGRHSVPALHDHKLEVYHNLILKIKPKNFKSDNNTSATCYILSRAAREVYDVLTVPSCLIPSTHSSSDKQYFERVKDQHKNASFSEIINRYSELSNRNDKFLDKDRRNSIMGDIRASIKKSRGNYNNKEGVMTKFKEQSEKSVSWEGGLSNIDNLTNSKERSAGKMTDFEKQNRGNMTGVAESFENCENSGEIPGIDSPNNLEEGKKTVAELAGYFNERLGNPKELPSKLTRIGVPTMGVNQVYLKQSKNKSVSWAEGLSNVNSLTDFKQSKKKSVSFAEGLSDVNNLTDSGIETPDADKSINLKGKSIKTIEELADAIAELKFKKAKKCIKEQESITVTASDKSILKEAIKKAGTKIDGLQGKKRNEQESKLQKIKDLINEKLYVIQNDHAPSVNGLDRAELEKADEWEKAVKKIAAAKAELKKAKLDRAELEKAALAKPALVQDPYFAIKHFDFKEAKRIIASRILARQEVVVDRSLLNAALHEAEQTIRLLLSGNEQKKRDVRLFRFKQFLERYSSSILGDHAQPVNANSSAEDANAEHHQLTNKMTEPEALHKKQALTQFAELQTDDELDSSSEDTTGTLADQFTEYTTPQTSDTLDSSSKAESEKIVAESTELEKAESEAEFERLAAASTELEKAESEAEFEKIVAESTELEKAESEAEFEKIVAASAELEKAASVQDLYLDHAQPVNANSSAEDVSAEKQALTQFAELQTDDELDSSSGEPLYSTIGSDPQSANGDDSQNLQLKVSANDTSTVDDDISSLSSDGHSSASSNVSDMSTTEGITDNEEEPVVATTDSKDGNDQLTGKGDSQGPQIVVIGNSNNVVVEDNDVPQNTKLPIIAASALTIAGVVSGAAITVCLEMLAVGIAVGACCLVAAAVIYCCTPKSSVENSNVETVKTAELTAQ
ncbi:TomO hydrophobic C-terminal domain-containing protein [Wolbachia endosymbiont of Oedothorax gibbosus]|uniref:TomO hydrophobic C-terminal domain-containing protein n=1 Tax=Wolbachia endosymbiont of Oedothorax gibbosus TaxID=931100 RepID=UPI0020257375|nr:hypothetical protein [Wolbachia endosymbiont of Oedothorax gibbosus]